MAKLGVHQKRYFDSLPRERIAEVLRENELELGRVESLAAFSSAASLEQKAENIRLRITYLKRRKAAP